MVKKSNKGQELLKELGRRESSRLTTKVSSSKSRVSSGIFRLIPTRFLWLIPWLKQNVKTSSLDPIKSKLPGKLFQKHSQSIPESESTAYPLETPQQTSLPLKPLYPKYRCLMGNPLACKMPCEIIEQNPKANSCLECGFPTILPPDTKIKGNRGTYQIETLLGYRGQGRLYQAIRMPDRQPVLIKEYLIPKLYFNLEEAQARKEAFTHLAGLHLADGRVQDFRLTPIIEAIADSYQNRCYLVSQGTVDTFPTLASHLAQNGAMPEGQVRQILNQVLQSLESIHGQKYRLPSGLVQQGLTHGNISLDSLLIVPIYNEFHIYLCDLALWEHRFNPPMSPLPDYSPSQDLKDLGYVAFYLLAGTTIDSVNHQPLDPRVEQHWVPVNPALKDFILSLIGFNFVPFESAEIARQVLLKLPQQQESQLLPTLPEQEKKSLKNRSFWLWIIGLGLGVFLLGLLIWFFSFRNRQQEVMADTVLSCCIGEISGIPSGKFTYTSATDGTWSYVLQRENLIEKDVTLEQELFKHLPELQLTYQPLPSAAQVLAAVRQEQADFAIASITNNLGSDLESKPIAYDALVVFVPFSYAQRDNSLPRYLNGAITLEQLRQIYTGNINNWKQLGGPDLRVKLYLPTNDEAVRIFEQRVLKEAPNIASFQQALKGDNTSNNFIRRFPQINRLQTFEMLRAIIQDFENENIGSIGIAPLSQVFGQCSVYPLAIVSENNESIQPLIQRNNQPVSPETDLCNDKGNYAPNINAIASQRYPLAYPLAVIYPRDNRREAIGQKFAEILRTVEAQNLLSKTGLVPLQ
jgi:ABC-type phosphate transport system substrate-binding protein